MSAEPDDLIALGHRLDATRSAFEEAKADARAAAARASAAGVPDTEIARRLQVDRMTVRSWLGKRQTTKKTQPSDQSG